MRSVDILIVEDNPGDVELVRESLSVGTDDKRLHVAQDGCQALAFLRRAEGFAGVPRPDLILLDLNLPKRSGEAVLQEIKEDPDLRRIPVVVFTSSSSAVDIDRSYELGANCYVTKPVDLERFETVMRSLENFWLTSAQLPGS